MTRRDTLMLLGALMYKARMPLRDVLDRHPEVPDAVALVSRGGEVELELKGAARRDTLFRITSMTKPVSAAAAMALVEEGKLRLDEPVERFLPELANRRVLKAIDGPLDDTVPARRPITLRDLLTMQMGFGIVLGPRGFADVPIVRAAEELKLGAFGPPKPLEPPPPDEWMRRFATLPLMHQPGEEWRYNTGFEVLGVLLARAAGKPLDAVLRERVLEPLGMRHTSFFAPASKLPPAYWMDGSIGDPPDGQWSRPPPFPSASAGLVSTIDDYLAFGRMMLGRGPRVLSQASIAEMTRDQIPPEVKARSPFFPQFWDGRGWGLGVQIEGSRFGWAGGFGTSWASDSAQDLVGIVMTQRAGPPVPGSIHDDLWKSLQG